MSYQLQVVWFHWDYGVQPDSLSRFTRGDEEFAAVHSVSLFFFFPRSYFNDGGLWIYYKVEVEGKKNRS